MTEKEISQLTQHEDHCVAGTIAICYNSCGCAHKSLDSLFHSLYYYGCTMDIWEHLIP